MKARIYNDTLNPNIWNNDKTIKPEVRDALLKVAQDFYAESELTAPIQDIYVLGSAANYNWGPSSDVDVHVLIDFNKLSMERELVKKMVDSIKANWNKNHNIQIKNHRVELYIQDITETNRALGIYSILNNKWIKVPQKLNLNLDKNAIQQKYTDMALQIKNAIKSNNLEDLKRVLKAVYDMRESGLTKSGEFSTENIVFKLLRTRGHLDNLKTAVNKVYDMKLSLKETK
jgi:predicted nucleotidyltransferase